MHHIHNLSSRNVVSRLSEMSVSDIQMIIVPIIELRARQVLLMVVIYAVLNSQNY